MAAAVIELDSLPDAIGAAAQNHDLLAGAGVGFAGAFVVRVEVRREAFELRGAGVHAAEDGLDAEFLAAVAHFDFAYAPGFGELRIADAEPLGGAELLAGGGGEGGLRQLAFEIHHLLHLLEEPGVDGGHLVDVGDAVAAGHGEADVVETVRRGRDEFVGDQALVVLLAAEGLAGFQAAYAFPHGGFEGAADGHHLADRFHLRAERGVRAGEFLERPLGDLDDDVVDGRLEAGGRLERDVVADLVEPVAHGELGGDFGDGEAGGLGGERGAARDARVHLDDDHAPVGRVDGELHVAAAGIDADLAQAAQGGVAHHLVFAIGEGLRGRHGDGIAGVHAHGVEVFDGADDDAVVGEIAHHLQLEFLPAERALFDQDFVDRAEGEAALQNFDELFLVVGDAAAGAAHGETGAQDARVADATRRTPGRR